MADAVTRLWMRLRSAIGVGRISSTRQGSGTLLAQMQFAGGEVRDNLPMLTLFGIASRPLPGSDAVAVFLGGDRGAGVVVGVGNRQYQGPALAEGEVALFTHEGLMLHLKLGKELVVTNADKLTATVATQVVLDCPDIRLGGAGASVPVQLANGNPATKVKAL